MQLTTLLGHPLMASAGWSRDDLKFTLGIVGAILVSLATLSDSMMASFGIGGHVLEYIRLGAFIVGVVSASAKTSGLPSAAAATSIKANRLGSLAVLLAVGCALLGNASACGPKTIPALPTVVATTDLDVRASIMRAYQDINGALLVVSAANQYEIAINAAAPIPANVHHATGAGIIATVRALDALNTDIKNKVVTTYAQVKARLDPILTQLNSLLSLAQGGGFNWQGLISGAITLLMDILNPALAGGPPAPCSFATHL